MSYPINYPTPQGANVQIFYGSGTTLATSANATQYDWIKPQGASFVWFTLIGAGSSGSSGSAAGGGSGAVTNCMVPAFLIPDVLRVSVGRPRPGSVIGEATTIIYQAKDGTGYTLLTANGGRGTGASGGALASTSNFFSCMGFFQSVAGQDGDSSSVFPSATTFLSGGTGTGSGTTVTANYGYSTPAGGSGFFQMQPIIVGVGGAGSSGGNRAGIGCGGYAGTASWAGGGLAVIITW